MKASRAFAPGNISLVFQVVNGNNPDTTGSKGVGFTINQGAQVEATHARATVVTYNEVSVTMPTVIATIQALTPAPLSIKITSPLPLGSGFGMSGASALAAAFAINALLTLGRSDLDLAHIAHRAEVIHKTGLGDVVNQYFGGFFVKYVSSAQFTVHTLPITPIPVYCLSYGKLLTSSILSNAALVGRINSEAQIALDTIHKLLQTQPEISFGEITAIANVYTKNTGLATDEVLKRIDEIEKRGGHAAMILLGNAVVSDIPFPEAIPMNMSSNKATLL